jgi:coenzyme F420-reducing hydrogenase beta subunit
MLEEGRSVLFSGTPCQIAGLRAFLGRDYDNLLTVDIVCHGVPAAAMLQGYIKHLEEKWGAPVTAFTFRDKTLGWGINGSAACKGVAGRKKLWQSDSAYLYYFTKGWIYRENCYECKYAGSHRPGDLTIGDFWGIEKQHPEYLGRNGWDESKGISFVFASSSKGEEAIGKLSQRLCMKPATFDEIAAGNGQLRHPSERGLRDEILAVYRDGGWEALEKRFYKKTGLRRYSSFIKSLIPSDVKRALKSRT